MADDRALRARRLAAQLLTRQAKDVAGAVAHLTAVQAQSTPAARLALRARVAGITAADVDRACADGAVVRTWLMRGTLHMVAAADVRWLVDLFGPANLKAGARRRKELGLTDKLCE